MSSKSVLRVSVAMCAALSFHGAAYAQDAEEGEETEVADGEYLGTIDIGESTRAIQTGTATATTRINREEIEDRQANTIAELIDTVPGVTLINGATPIGSGINIRGFGANGTYGTDQKVLILIDGATTGSEELYRIGTQLFTDPLLYKSVDVIRGTVGSFEYGSGVIGGVVRLETNDAYDVLGGQPGVGLSQVLGGFTNGDGWSTSTTVAAMPSENVEFLANYSYREGGTQSDGNGDPIENSEFELPSFLVKGGVHFGQDNEHTIEASFSQSETSERDKPYDSFGTSGGAFGNVDRDTTSKTFVAGYYFNPIANDLIDLSLVYSFSDQDIEQEYVEGSSPFAPPGGFAVVSADHSYETSKVTLKNGALFSTGGVRHALRIGAEYIHKDRLDASSAPGGTDDRLAAFLVDELNLFRGFTLTPAIRYETSSVEGILDDGSAVSYDNDAFMGGVSARYELPFGLAVFGSWAHTESLPILDDLENETYMTQPEQGETWEVGASFDRVGVFTANDRVALKVNYYDTELTDNTSYSGVLEVYLEGFEIEASYATASGFYLDFNGNIVDGERLRTSGVIDDWTNLPNNTYRLAAGKRFGRTFDIRWEAYVSEDLTTRTGSITDGVTTYESSTVEGTNVHNLRASFTPDLDFIDNLTLRVSVENIFDKFYTDGLATRPAPGRTFKGSISLQI
ncbi:TonB-dependent receptor plug domain-containing protein [Alteraurantiacibacter aquimixticola]|uniref:Ligand-gated channel n=1 Tax=Alteraurantiacibacter aquimixticola TaxID=2489173 RepID=A0A4T3F4H8_9SPHN|nr:TonB-dependent receptor plug domain-containing protein [Alteraurantiacibacter aquimixticola]TIX51691.1 ligand-gated channel [Alteraurantiacibacter aquimixticola]